MSIELIGPAKYEFQYLVSAYLSLPFLQNEANEVIIEQRSGEDLQLKIDTDAFSGTVEVQVKGSSQDADLSFVCNCLAHFPANSDKDCLLERVLNRTDDISLIVASGRCNDDIRGFVLSDDWRGEIHEDPPIKVQSTASFRQEFKQQWKGDSDLYTARRKRCEELADTLKPTPLSNTSKRIVILERLNETRLADVLVKRLTGEYLVPRSQLKMVTMALYDTVKDARGTGQNIRPDLYRILAQYLTPIVPLSYLPRGDEDPLVQELLQKKLLLLTGASQCGKTFISLAIAGEMQKKGWFVRSGSEAQEARRFLAEPGPEERLFVLDDPFGHESLQDRAREDFAVIRSLASSLPPSKRLVITSREDILAQLMGGNSPDFGTFQWHNLGSPVREFLAALWDHYSPHDSTMHAEIRSAILDPSRETLEPGQIARLAALTDEERAQKNLADLWLEAKENSRFLSYALVNRGKEMQDVLVALALTTEPFFAVADEDIAFVLSGAAERPGEMKTAFLGMELGGGIVEGDDAFPTYPERYMVGQKHLDELAFLQRRKFLARDRTAATYNFTHPTYRAAAEYAILEAFDIEDIAGMVERALLSLSPTSASAASRKLGLISRLFQKHNRSSQLFSLVMLGLRSIFLATRDNCFSYLCTHFETLPPQQKEEFLKQSKYVHVSEDHVMWHSGHAWIKADVTLWHIFGDREEEDAEQFLKELAEVSAPQQLSAARAHQVVKYLETKPGALKDTVMNRLLTYEESLIRGGAAKVWLNAPRTGDEALLESIFSDRNATVVVYALEGVIAGWGACNAGERERLLPYLAAALGNPVNAFLALTTATRIYKNFHGDDTPPWDLWVRILCVLLTSVPETAVMDEDKFYYCATRSMAAVNLDLSLPFFAAWIEWIEKQILRRVPSDCVLSVTSMLVETTQDDPAARRPLMSRLLQQRETSFAVIVVRDCVEKWGLLSQEEKTGVISILKEERKDSRWLKAVVLTRKSVPAELQSIVLGKDNFLDLDPGEIAREMPRQILEDCIAVTAGHPWILDHIGLNTGISRKWIDVRNIFLNDPNDPLFDIALRELFYAGKAAEVQAVYEKVFTASPEKLFLHLFESGFRINSAEFIATWVYALHNAPDVEKYKQWIALIADNIETLDEKAGLISGILDHKIMPDLLSRLPFDGLIYMLLYRIVSMDDAPTDLYEDCCQKLKIIYKKGTPKVLYVNNLAENFAKKRCSSDRELLSLMEKARHTIVDNFNHKSPLENPVWDDYELEGWVQNKS